MSRGRGVGTLKILLAVALAVCLVPASATAATVANGGFETGNFAGWSEQDQIGSAGSWYVYSGTTSPDSGHTIPAPPQGNFAAITDQTDPSASVLYQDVSLEAGAKHTLSLYVYYNSYAPIASPTDLDYTDPYANQQYRIDVMKPSAALNSTSPSDILETLFATKTGGPTSMSPTLLKFDLTPFAGQTVRLRFAMTDNDNYFNAGVDAVTITSTPAASTLPVTGLKAKGATLNGTVNPAAYATTYHFQYGTTTAYGSTVPVPDAAVGSDSSVHPESQKISGLKPNKTYHYRIVATNANGTTDGADMTFSTTAKVSKVSQSHKKWSAANKKAKISSKGVPVGTTFKFTLNEGGVKVRFTFKTPGKHHKVLGTLTFKGHAGVNKVKFYGRLKHTTLAPGKYTVVITTPGYGPSKKKLTFTIVA